MLEKLFVRVRSWLHVDPAAVAPAGGGQQGVATAPPGSISGPGNGFSRSAVAPTATGRGERHVTPPPPMPGEAFGDSGEIFSPSMMEAQPESGMVITESGIIIIDPNAQEAQALTKLDAKNEAKLQAVTADTSWALPNLAGGNGSNGSSTSAAAPSDWDAVLARARAQLSSPPPPAGNSGKSRK
jgi:hypothetical protein